MRHIGTKNTFWPYRFASTENLNSFSKADKVIPSCFLLDIGRLLTQNGHQNSDTFPKSYHLKRMLFKIDSLADLWIYVILERESKKH